MGIVNRDGALYMATGIDNSGLYSGRREAMGIIKAMASQITSFDVFSGIGISAATAFASAAKSSYDFEKEFQKNMLEVATISTQVEGSMTDFMNQVMEITQKIPIKAPEAAKALYQIVSAGHDGADGMKVLEVSARSAIGGMTDTATSADAITTLINAYKLSVSDAERVSDQLFTTARLGKTTFGELGQSIAQVAPIAASYGVEMDQVLAAVATLTKSGTPTAQAMTQIRASIIGASKVLGDGAFNTRTFQEGLAEIAARAGGSESKLRELIPEVEAVNGVLGLTGIKAQDAAEHLKAMNDSAGATSAAFELMMNDVDKQMTLLSNNIQAALRPMGQAILKEVSEVAEAFNEAFANGDLERSLSTLKTLLELTAIAWGTYKVSVAAAMVVENLRYQSSLAHMQGLTKMQALLSVLKGKTDALTASMLKNPYALMAAAVAALGYGLYKLWTYQTQAQKNQEKLNETIIEFNVECLKEERSMNQLFDALGRANKGTVERKKIIDTINTQYGKYLPNLLTEESSLDDINAAYKAINTSLKEQIALKIRNTATDKIVTEGVQTQAGAISKMRKSLQERIKNSGLVDAMVEEIKQTTDEFQKSGSTWEKAWQQAYANVQRKYSGRIKLGNGFASSMEDYVRSVFDTETAVALIEKQYEPFINKIQAENEKVEDAVEVNVKGTVVDDKTLQKQKELRRLILDNELRLQADRIAAMEDGKAKRIALAEQEYRETVATIQKEKEEYQKKIKEAKGKEDPVVLSSFDNREMAAGDKKNTDVAKVEKEYTEEYKRRTKELTSVFLNEEQRKLTAIKDRYDQERKWADEQLKTGGMSKDEYKDYTSTIDKAQIQDNYNTLLDSLNDYKYQEKVLREKWDTDINAAVEAKDAYLVAKLMEGKEKALSALNSQMLQESSEWMRLFGNLDTLTVTELNKLIDSIQKQIDSGSIKLNPVDMKALMDSLNEAKEKVAEKSPFQSLAKSSGEMKKALADLKQAEDDGLTGQQLDVYKKKVKDSAENVKKSIAAIGDAYNQVSDVMKSAADLIGMVDEGLGETVSNAIALGDAVMNVGEVVANAVIAFAAGMNAMESASVILLVIKAVLMAVMAAMALFNGDKKHEKKIKKLQDEVDKLSRAYDRLGEAIEDAYSFEKANLLDKESENLRQQNELIRQQIKEEKDKKKTDKDKIKDWQNTIEDNNRKIEENSKKGRVEAIMGSDIKSAIDEFAQAYADAWAAGEKAAGKSANIVKNLIRTSIIEMLKSKLKPEVEEFMTFLSGAMADGIIDASEQRIIDNWEKKLESIADSTLAGKDKWLKDDNLDNSLGISSDSMADTIAEGLQVGKSGIKDFASSFEDMMREAVLSSLKTKYLEGPLKEFQKKFSELSESDGQLTEAEIEELRGMYADIISGAKDQFDSLKEISGLDFTNDSDNTLKGAYAKASQESIDLLAGQTGAVRVLMEDIRGSMQPIREQIRLIYDMQSKGWEDVKAIRELSDKVEKNTGQIAETTKEVKEIASKISENTRGTIDALEGTINVKVKM